MQALVIRPRHSISGSIVLMWSADLSARESNDNPELGAAANLTTTMKHFADRKAESDAGPG